MSCNELMQTADVPSSQNIERLRDIKSITDGSLGSQCLPCGFDIVKRRAVTEQPRVESRLARSELFACEAVSVGAARRFVAGCVEQLGLGRLSEVQLMVSELATNAVQHSGSRFDVTVERLIDSRVRVEVRDSGPGLPRRCEGGTDADSGRGLRIIDLLAETWGVVTRPGGVGKSTWFIVPSA